MVQELKVCIRVYDSPVGRNAKTATNWPMKVFKYSLRVFKRNNEDDQLT